MTDLQIAMAVVVGSGIGAFFVTMSLARSIPRWAGVILVGAIVGALAFFAIRLLDSVAMARLLPFPNVIVLGNWLPILVGALGGATWPLIPGGKLRRSLLLIPLSAAGLFEMYRPFRSDPPAVHDEWVGEMCMQSSAASCSPAAAATLLRHYRIKTTEAEMVELCITRPDGTNLHGLFRGLKLKSAGTEWDAEVFQADKEQLRRMLQSGPVLLNVRLPRQIDPESVYVKQWGWVPGQGHTVVAFRLNDTRLVIADPAVGLEEWDLSVLDVLWEGQGARLVKYRGNDE